MTNIFHYEVLSLAVFTRLWGSDLIIQDYQLKKLSYNKNKIISYN